MGQVISAGILLVVVVAIYIAVSYKRSFLVFIYNTKYNAFDLYDKEF